MKYIHVAALAIAAAAALPAAAQQSAGVSGNARASAGFETYELAQMRSYVDVIAALEANGYVVDEVKRTLLGRVRISARNTVHARELVVSRSTGEIMSDTIVIVFAEGQGSGAPASSATGAVTGIVGGVDLGVGVDVNVGADVGGTLNGATGGLGGTVSVGAGASGGLGGL